MACIIADTGPLLALAKLNRLNLLQGLFGTITVPTAVWRESQAKPGTDSESIRQAIEAGWLQVVEVDLKRVYPRSLHQGESEALQLALDHPSSLLIVDDQLARREAHRLQVNFVGTVRVLALAEQQGLLESAANTIEAMRAEGYRISVRFLDAARHPAPTGRDT